MAEENSIFLANQSFELCLMTFLEKTEPGKARPKVGLFVGGHKPRITPKLPRYVCIDIYIYVYPTTQHSIIFAGTRLNSHERYSRTRNRSTRPWGGWTRMLPLTDPNTTFTHTPPTQNKAHTRCKEALLKPHLLLVWGWGRGCMAACSIRLYESQLMFWNVVPS